MLGIPYRIDQIAHLTHAADLFQGQAAPQLLRYVAFDTRVISHGPETLFVAIKTNNRDGHDFIQEAWKKGVRNFIVDRPVSYKEVNYILSIDPLESLQLWAMHHRCRFSYPVLGITGSNGKTIVKEWLTTLLEQQFQVVKSPMSYNSQLGVALSLLQMHPDADLAIIEAGISQPDEMAVLHQMIQPTLGMLTHMGNAHAEGFSSSAQKLAEKCLLFTDVEQLFTTSLQGEVLAELRNTSYPLITIGSETNDQIQVEYKRSESGWQINWREGEGVGRYELPLTGESDVENALLAIVGARHFGVSPTEIAERLALLYPIDMRTELISDNPHITLINDSYNSDVDSVRNAFRMLHNTAAHPNRHIILTDIPHQGDTQIEIHTVLLKEAIELAGSDRVRTIGPIFQALGHRLSYSNTQSLIADFRYEDFVDSVVLLKGARQFELEQLIPLFNQQLNATWLKVDLNALSHNFRLLKSLVPPGTKTMCMVKAFSYGSGTWEIARELEKEGATYLTVAYPSEGVELRNAGIELPVMVMNADVASIPALIRFDIEPEVHSLDFLERYVRACRMADLTEYRIHLKLETGMGRLGFHESELEELIACIGRYPDLTVISVMSHLAAADDPSADVFSLAQIEQFDRMYAKLQQALGLQAFRHILNTAGIIRFSQYAMDMVRLGIGLYGIDPTQDFQTENRISDFQEMGSLFSRISRIQQYPAGVSIGYGRSQFAKRETRIAVIPIGYADGIPRNLSNGKMAFLVRGKRAPIFGRVCMDMLMLDITDIPEAIPGDEVVIFGRQGSAHISIGELAEAAGTIPYEILVRISPRVRRVYVRE